MVNEIQHFLLILIRISAFIAMSPGFSFTSLPNLSKLAISVGITMSIMSFVAPVSASAGILSFIFIGVKELFVGLALAYITVLFFAGVEMAGSLVDFQVGFSMGQIYDPSLGINVSNYGRVYYWLSIGIFFLANIHHQVIRSLVLSYEYLPLDHIAFTHFGTEGMVRLFAQVFEIALNLAIPLIIVAVLSELTLALVSRTVPQINVLILGMPMKTLVSLIFMFFFLSTLMKDIGDIFPEMIRYMNEFIRSLSP